MNAILLRLAMALLLCIGGGSDENSRDVNIAAIFTFSTINGRVARIAINAAVEDINSDPSILGGRKLVLSMRDSNYSSFSTIIGGRAYYLPVSYLHVLACCLKLF